MELLLTYMKVLQMQDDVDAVDIILRRRLQGVVTFGFEYGWTKADVFDAWSLTGNIGSCLTCDMRTLLVISTTSECKQNGVSAV